MANGALTAEDYQGLNPEQIAQVRQLGQQSRQQKMQLLQMAIDSKIQERKMQIDAQRADAYDKMVQAQTLQAEAAAQAQRRKMEDYERKSRFLESMQNTTLKTQWGEMPATQALMMKEYGFPIKAQEGDKVIDTFQDDEGNVRALIVRNGSVDVTSDFEDLQGFDKLPDKEVQLSPGERAEETARGRTKGDIGSADWIADLKEAAGRQYELTAFSPRKEDQRKAKKLLRQQAKNSIWNIYGQEEGAQEVLFADGPKGPGFYLTYDDGTAKYITGDVN
jgi:hypothetical protein